VGGGSPSSPAQAPDGWNPGWGSRRHNGFHRRRVRLRDDLAKAAARGRAIDPAAFHGAACETDGGNIKHPTQKTAPPRPGGDGPCVKKPCEKPWWRPKPRTSTRSFQIRVVEGDAPSSPRMRSRPFFVAVPGTAPVGRLYGDWICLGGKNQLLFNAGSETARRRALGSNEFLAGAGAGGERESRPAGSRAGARPTSPGQGRRFRAPKKTTRRTSDSRGRGGAGGAFARRRRRTAFEGKAMARSRPAGEMGLR